MVASGKYWLNNSDVGQFEAQQVVACNTAVFTVSFTFSLQCVLTVLLVAGRRASAGDVTH